MVALIKQFSEIHFQYPDDVVSKRLYDALRIDPRFIAAKPVNSPDGKTRGCWIFSA